MFTANKVRRHLGISSRSAAIEQHLTVLAHMANLETMMWTIQESGLDGLSDAAIDYLKSDTTGGIQDLRNTLSSIAERFEAHSPTEFELIQIEQQQTFTESLGSAILSGFIAGLRRKHVEEEMLKSLIRISKVARANSWPEIRHQLSNLPMRTGHEHFIEVSLPWNGRNPHIKQSMFGISNVSRRTMEDVLVIFQQTGAKGSAVGFCVDEFEEEQVFGVEWPYSQLQVSPSNTRKPIPIQVFVCSGAGILVNAPLSQRPGTRVDVSTPQAASQGKERILLDGIALPDQEDATDAAKLAMKHLATYETLISQQLSRIEKPLARRLVKSRSPDARSRYEQQILELQQWGQFPDYCREKESEAILELTAQFDRAMSRLPITRVENSDASEAARLASKTVRALYGKLISQASENR
ncbi:MAG: hypothetical protein Aurels2KO_55000 [Aureliella sp.]